jgi:release factor glutamine methyltransferase
VSNPPYIAFEEARELPASVRAWEPPLALFSADGGLALTKEILAGAPAHIHSGGLLALEVDSRRAATVAEMIAATGRFSDIRVHLDLTGRERFVIARRS